MTTINGVRHLTLSSQLGDTSFSCLGSSTPLDDEPLITRNVGVGRADDLARRHAAHLAELAAPAIARRCVAGAPAKRSS